MRIADLRNKEVINVSDGHRLGYIGDIDMDPGEGRVLSLIVPGPYKFFGLFGRGDDYVLPWDCILKIGDDIILADDKGRERRSRREKTDSMGAKTRQNQHF